MKHAERRKQSLLIPPQTFSAGGTAGATFDTIGCDYVSLIIPLSAGLNTNAVGPTISVLAADNTTVSNFVTVTEDFVAELGTAGRVALVNIDKRNIGSKRYVRTVITRATTTNDVLNACVVAEKWRNDEGPLTIDDCADQVVVV